MTEAFRIEDRGDRRVLWVGERPSMPTHYSERVIRMLIERKGAERAPLYFPFKAERAPHFLGPLFRYLRARGCRGLRVLEVGCSFGHMTEYLAEQPEIAALSTFDTDAAFVDIARTKAKELGLTVVREILHARPGRDVPLCRGPTARSTWSLAVGVVEHLPERHRRAQVDEYWRVLAPGGHIAILDTPNRYVSPRDALGAPAPRPVSAPPARLSLRETLRDAARGESSTSSRPTAPAGATPPLARVPAVERVGRRRGRHRGGRLRLSALLP